MSSESQKVEASLGCRVKLCLKKKSQMDALETKGHNRFDIEAVLESLILVNVMEPLHQ